MSNLFTFLKSYETKSNQQSTNVSLPPSRGKWSIPDEEYETFLNLYSNELLNQSVFYMTELHKSYGPIIIDLDFKQISCERNYNLQDILCIIDIYNNEICKYLEIENNEDLVAYVLEKSEVTKLETYNKDGIHITYPYIICSNDVQYKIREQVVEICKTKEIFRNLDLVENYTVDEIIDISIIKKTGWMMYKSKKQGNNAYELTMKIDHNLETVQIIETMSDLVKLLSIRNKEESKILKTKIIQKPIEIETIPINNNNDSDIVDTNYEYIRTLVNMLSDERSDKRETWIETGACLYNINQHDCLEFWDDFSKKSSKYKPGVCETEWKSFKNYEGRRLSIGSLHMWAKTDNEELYKKAKRDFVSNYLLNNIECTHNDVAMLLHCKYEFDFICSSIKFKTWYKYELNRWVEMDNAVDLRYKISDEIVNEYKKVSQIYQRKSLQDPEDQEIITKINTIDKIIKSLKDRKFKENVMKECEDLFNDVDFDSLADSKVNLIGFKNGIYDLEKMEFRNGRPDDYVTFSTGFDYVPYNEKRKEVKEMNDFLSKEFFPRFGGGKKICY